jgi:ferrochelatase
VPCRVEPYDALLLVSFGGPEKPDDVLPFLRNVTRGRAIPPERLEQVGEHYFRFGGRSPINDQCRALRDAVEADFRAHGIGVDVYWGNRNWHPYLRDTLVAMADAGVRRAACLLTSAYPSYSGCRQYRENLWDAAASLEDAPQLDRLRHYNSHAGFVNPFVDATAHALQDVPEGSRLVFVTHSLPAAMAAGSGPDGGAYERQHRQVAAEVARRVGRSAWDLVYCSRSGAPRAPWLEPDINDHLAALAGEGTPGVVVVPIGFVTDHMQVVYDLDTQARATAERLGLPLARAATPGTDPRFVAMVRDLLLERAALERGDDRADVDRSGNAWADAAWDTCPAGCCPNPQGERPALCGSAGGRPMRVGGP